MTLKLQVELELTGFSSFYRVYLYSRGWYYLKLLGNGFQRVHLLVSHIAKYLQPNLREQHGLLGNVEGPTHKCESASSGDNNQNISISKPKYFHLCKISQIPTKCTLWSFSNFRNFLLSHSLLVQCQMALRIVNPAQPTTSTRQDLYLDSIQLSSLSKMRNGWSSGWSVQEMEAHLKWFSAKLLRLPPKKI